MTFAFCNRSFYGVEPLVVPRPESTFSTRGSGEERMIEKRCQSEETHTHTNATVRNRIIKNTAPPRPTRKHHPYSSLEERQEKSTPRARTTRDRRQYSAPASHMFFFVERQKAMPILMQRSATCADLIGKRTVRAPSKQFSQNN